MVLSLMPAEEDAPTEVDPVKDPPEETANEE